MCTRTPSVAGIDQPDPVSRINPSSVKHQVTPECPASPGQRIVPRRESDQTCDGWFDYVSG